MDPLLRQEKEAELCFVEARAARLLAACDAHLPISEVSALFNISRKAARNWRERWQALRRN